MTKVAVLGAGGEPQQVGVVAGHRVGKEFVKLIKQ